MGNPYVKVGTAVAGPATGGMFSWIGARKRRREARRVAEQAQEYGREMAESGQQHNIDMWEMQARYNTPEEQMKRLKQAGLNPNLIYGDSPAGASGAMSRAPEPVVPEPVVPELGKHQMEATAQHVPDMIDLFTRMYQMRQQEIGIGTAHAIEHKTRREGALAGERQLSVNMDNSIKRAAFDDLVKKLKHQASLTKSRSEREKILKQITQLELEMNRTLRPYGMTSQDHVGGRILLKILENFGIDMEGLIGPTIKRMPEPRVQPGPIR